MKSLIKAVALAALVAAPVVSFAQSNQQPLTRAQCAPSWSSSKRPATTRTTG